MYPKRILFTSIAFTALMLLAVISMPSEVQGQTPTSTPYVTSTLPYCPATLTPTSMFPTREIPTFEGIPTNEFTTPVPYEFDFEIVETNYIGGFTQVPYKVGVYNVYVEDGSSYGNPTAFFTLKFEKGQIPMGTKVYYRAIGVFAEVQNIDGFNRSHHYRTDNINFPNLDQDSYYSVKDLDVTYHVYPEQNGFITIGMGNDYMLRFVVLQDSSFPNYKILSWGLQAVEFSLHPFDVVYPTITPHPTSTPTLIPTATSTPSLGAFTGIQFTPEDAGTIVTPYHLGIYDWYDEPNTQHGPWLTTFMIAWSRGSVPAGTTLYYRWRGVWAEVQNVDGFNRNHSFWQDNLGGIPNLERFYYYSVPHLSTRLHYYDDVEEGSIVLSGLNYRILFNASQDSSTPTQKLLRRGLEYFEVSAVPFVSTTPTPTPTTTPQVGITATPTGEWCINNPNIPPIWKPPHVTPGPCITLLPNITIPVPDIVQTIWEAFIPDEIGVPGVAVCLWFWDWEVEIFDFKVSDVLTLFAALTGVVLLVREFRS